LDLLIYGLGRTTWPKITRGQQLVEMGHSHSHLPSPRLQQQAGQQTRSQGSEPDLACPPRPRQPPSPDRTRRRSSRSPPRSRSGSRSREQEQWVAAKARRRRRGCCRRPRPRGAGPPAPPRRSSAPTSAASSRSVNLAGPLALPETRIHSVSLATPPLLGPPADLASRPRALGGT